MNTDSPHGRSTNGSPKDWYATLGVRADATEAELDTAIERMSRQASVMANTAPERSQQMRDTIRMMRSDILSGTAARQRYDAEFRERKTLSTGTHSESEPAKDARMIPSNAIPTPNRVTPEPQLGDRYRYHSPTLSDASSRPSITDAVVANVIPLASRFRRFLSSGWTCPSCSAEGSPEDQFCKSCGAAMKSIQVAAGARCTKCETELAANDRFCSRCGTPTA